MSVTKSLFSEKYDRFRQLLIAARKEAGLTQTEVAEKLSRPQSYISKSERGERRLDVVEFFDVAQAIGLDPYAFLHTLNNDSSALPSEVS